MLVYMDILKTFEFDCCDIIYQSNCFDFRNKQRYNISVSMYIVFIDFHCMIVHKYIYNLIKLCFISKSTIYVTMYIVVIDFH